MTAKKKYPSMGKTIQKKKIYLCGPIDSRCVADVPKAQIVERFKKMELYFRHLGFDVVNPIEFGEELKRQDSTISLQQIMNEEIQIILSPDVTHMLLMEKWHYSKGCVTEHLMAGRRQFSRGAPLMNFINYDSGIVDYTLAEVIYNEEMDRLHKEELQKHLDNKEIDNHG